jgi:hypothetical protein
LEAFVFFFLFLLFRLLFDNNKSVYRCCFSPKRVTLSLSLSLSLSLFDLEAGRRARLLAEFPEQQLAPVLQPRTDVGDQRAVHFLAPGVDKSSLLS